jgi:hypothetical protein
MEITMKNVVSFKSQEQKEHELGRRIIELIVATTPDDATFDIGEVLDEIAKVVATITSGLTSSHDMVRHLSAAIKFYEKRLRDLGLGEGDPRVLN